MKRGLLRFLALMMTLLLVVGAVAGCGKKDSSSDNKKKASDKVEESIDEETSVDEEASTVEESQESTDATVEESTAEESTKEESTKKESTQEVDKTKEESKDSGKKTTTSSKTTTGEKTTTPSKSTSTNKPAPVGKVDLKGYTIKIVAWWNLDPKVPTNVYYEKAVQREKEVRAKYNVKFQYINVPGQGIRDKLPASVLAGDPIGDIVRCRSGWVLPTFAGKGYIEPADKYFDVSDPLWNPYVIKQSMYKGHPMGVNHGALSSYMAMLYNRSMMQRLGLPDPQSLVASKQWTWAKFEEYIKKIAKDSNGDGKIDIYGTTIPSWQAAVASNGGKIVSDINGKDVFTLNRPEAVEALKWMQKIIKMNVAGGDMTDFANGKVGFMWWANYEWGFKNTMKDKWGLLPTPMGPKAKDYTAWWDEVHLMCIPKNSKYPKETAAIWTDLSRWYPGVSGRDQMYRDSLENQYQDPKDVDMAIFISKKFWLDKYFAYRELMSELWPGGGQDIENVIDGSAGKTIDQWMAEKSGKMQNIIDQLWASFK